MSFQFLVCQLTYDFFLHKSQYMSISRMCVSIDVHFFLCKFLRVKREKLAKTLSNIYIAPNVACRQRYKTLRFLCETTIFGSHVAPTTSDTPRGDPGWSQWVWPPFVTKHRLPTRSRAVTTGCAPPPLTLIEMHNP
jgi:hypothetical protein